MKKYVVIFVVVNLLLNLVLGITLTLLDVGGGAGLNIIATIASSWFAASQFTRDQRRLPTPEETITFTRFALVWLWLLSLLLVLPFWAFYSFVATDLEMNNIKSLLTSKMFFIVGTIGFIVMTVIYYVVIKWSFGWYAKQSLKA